MKTSDTAIRDFILKMAANGPRDISVPNIVLRCGGNAQIARHVLKHLVEKKEIQVEGNYQEDEYFSVRLPH